VNYCEKRHCKTYLPFSKDSNKSQLEKEEQPVVKNKETPLTNNNNY